MAKETSLERAIRIALVKRVVYNVEYVREGKRVWAGWSSTLKGAKAFMNHWPEGIIVEGEGHTCPICEETAPDQFGNLCPDCESEIRMALDASLESKEAEVK